MKSNLEPRIRKLRAALGWSQSKMGDYLGVSQPAVFNLENGQKESGPVSKLLDQLEGSTFPADADADGQYPYSQNSDG